MLAPLKIITILLALFFFWAISSPPPDPGVISAAPSTLQNEPPAEASPMEQKERKTTPIPNDPEAKKAQLPPPAPNGEGISFRSPLPASPATTSPQPPDPPWEEIHERLRAALVNIICTSRLSGSFEPVTGTGVIVDPRGIILTTAHVAQYLFLRDYPVPENIECLIRSGSPAEARYRAQLLFLSPSWIEHNASAIASSSPTGTGENDYALLLITNTTSANARLPEAFPSVEVETTPLTIQVGDEVLLAAYPAGFFGGITIQRYLYSSASFVKILKLYTFSEAHVDLMSLGGSLVAQRGSSGGAVMDRRGKLIGLIVTATSADETSGRDLRAITLPYIARVFEEEAGFSFRDILTDSATRDLTVLVSQFTRDFSPALSARLIAEFEKKWNPSP